MHSTKYNCLQRLQNGAAFGVPRDGPNMGQGDGDGLIMGVNGNVGNNFMLCNLTQFN